MTAPAGDSPESDEAHSRARPFARRVLMWALLAGAALSLCLLSRTQVGGDQLFLLAHGWRLAAFGELLPYGNPLSGGGFDPGPATSLLVGLPLALWENHRSPALFVWATHLAAFALLGSRLRRALSPGELAAFALVYWLNPWRLSASAVLWNPNFLFLLGAIHFVTVFDQRERARFGSSFAHLVALGIAAQLHPSALLLLVLSLALAATRTVRVHWPGAIAGGLVSLATLWPWLELARQRPEILPGEEGFLFRAAALVQPWIKGLSYWLRYPSLSLPQESTRVDFTAALGAGVDGWLAPTFVAFAEGVGALTVLVALAANVSLFRGGASDSGLRGALALFRRRGASGAASVGERELVLRYVLFAALAAIVVVAASPTTPQSWQLLPLFHAAVLPVALWLGARLTSPTPRTRRLARQGAVAAAAVALLLTLGIAFGARNFRCGGRNALQYPLLHDSPMLEALNVQQTCPWVTNVPGGGWPADVPISPGR